LQQTRQVVLGEEWALKDGRILERDHVPIYVEGRLRSVLWVYRDITSRKQQEETLRQLATTDALTGIANRRSFMEKLADEFARFQRFSNPVAVLMLDIDHFKRVNDTWGHAVGDKVLHDFAAICQQVVRKVDVVGRLGGEEFAVLLPGCGMAGALALAERMREAVRSHVIQVGKPVCRYAPASASAALPAVSRMPVWRWRWPTRPCTRPSWPVAIRSRPSTAMASTFPLQLREPGWRCPCFRLRMARSTPSSVSGNMRCCIRCASAARMGCSPSIARPPG
jgi:diguanylate cyclase (GGDEF)-like protein